MFQFRHMFESWFSKLEARNARAGAREQRALAGWRRALFVVMVGVPVAATIGVGLWHFAAFGRGELTAFAFGMAFVLIITPPSAPAGVVVSVALDARRGLGLDPARLKSMARLRRSRSRPARAIAVAAARAAIGAVLACDVTRRIAARLLASLGAVIATAQPRFAASLVAGSTAFSAA